MRLAQPEDLQDLAKLAALAGVGLTTLPQNRDLLAQRIAASQASVSREVERPGSESYLFVLEHEATVSGTAALYAAVGTEEAFYNYRVGLSVFASRELGVYQQVPTLYLANDLTGATELATLFLAPQLRGQGAAQLLTAARYLFMGAFPARFAERVIAELRGWADEKGESPFWEGLGRQFFSMDFSRADRLSAQTRAFIAELMPQHPLYTVLLPASARDVIAKVHPDTLAARRLLEAQGFAYNSYIDIFDAGPVVEAPRRRIRAINAVARRKIVDAPLATDGESRRLFVAQSRGDGFFVHALRGMDDGECVQLLDAPEDLDRHLPAWVLDARALGTRPS